MTLRDVNFFYNQLAISHSAGISLPAFFETLLTSEKNEKQRAKINMILLGLKQGRTLAQSLAPVEFVPFFDVPLIKAGEKSGKMQEVLKTLEKKYHLAATAEKEIKQKLYLPGLLFVAASFVPSLPSLILGSITAAQYFGDIVLSLGMVTVILYLLNYFFQRSFFDRQIAKLWHLVFLKLPFFCGLMKKIALEKFCSGLALSLDAGFTAYEALAMAGETSADRQLHLASCRMIGELKGGKTLVRVFEMESIFTADVIRSVRLGHEAGELPNCLQQSSKRLKQEIDSSITALCVFLPTAAHWIVMAYVAYSVIGMHLSNISYFLSSI